MSSNTSVERKGLGVSLLALKLSPPNNLQAIQLIKDCVRLDVEIPKALYPWISKACNAWISEQGNIVSPVQTAQRKADYIWHIRLYIHLGDKPGKAIEKVADWSGMHEDTLSTYYYNNKAQWAEFDEEIRMQNWDYTEDIDKL